MMIDIPGDVIDDLRTLLETLEEVAFQHDQSGIADVDEIIEPWTPSPNHPNDEPQQISCPEFTVATLKLAQSIKKKLRM
jgi:hypothetical protein